MKKLLVCFFALFSFSVFAQSCKIGDVACDFPMDPLMQVKASIPDGLDKYMGDEPPECPIDNPDCPLPDGVRAPTSTNMLAFLCISVNPRIRRYGVAFSYNHNQSALLSYLRCRQASGWLQFFCQRPHCLAVPF